MKEIQPTCPRCQVAMSPGALRAVAKDWNWAAWFAYNRVEWNEQDKEQPFRIFAYRCDKCGKIELFATEPPK